MIRGLRAALLLAITSAMAATTAFARPGPGQPRTRRSGFRLLASTETAMTVNRPFCGLNNLGQVCTALAGSPVGESGIWPKGSPDTYVYNSGLQLAAIIPPTAGFSWAGDTVGAYFMDPRGDQTQGEGLTSVYSSLDPADVSAWPNGGVVRDAALYNPVLLQRNIISQQDVWFRTWDGNASFTNGRKHPMGVAVDVRGMGWNYPTGNEDIIYFVYTFYNITASDPAKYAGIDPAIRDEIAAVGQQFHDGVKAKLGVTIPAGGFRYDSLYSAFFMDADVGDYTNNYTTAILPFNLGMFWKSDWNEPSWQFPPDMFGAPFAAAPGFVGVKYLKSPIDPATSQEVGLTLFSQTTNSATIFPDPVGVVQLWRYLSGSLDSRDNPCTFPRNQVKARKMCYLGDVGQDVRSYEASGPFSLSAGQSATIVVAYIWAAPVGKWVKSYIGGDLKPGVPPSGAEIGGNPALVRAVDSIAGNPSNSTRWSNRSPLDVRVRFIEIPSVIAQRTMSQVISAQHQQK